MRKLSATAWALGALAAAATVATVAVSARHHPRLPARPVSDDEYQRIVEAITRGVLHAQRGANDDGGTRLRVAGLRLPAPLRQAVPGQDLLHLTTSEPRLNLTRRGSLTPELGGERLRHFPRRGVDSRGERVGVHELADVRLRPFHAAGDLRDGRRVQLPGPAVL